MITATCHRLALPEPPGWRWQPATDWAGDQPVLPDLPASVEPAVLADAGVPAEVVQRFAHLIVEVIQGRRKPGGLETVFDPAALQALTARLPVLRPLGCRLASIRAQAPRPGVVEVTLRLAGTRSIAVALREVGQGRDWRCTALVIG